MLRCPSEWSGKEYKGVFVCWASEQVSACVDDGELRYERGRERDKKVVRNRVRVC